MIEHGFHDCGKDALRDFGAYLDAVVPVLKDFRLDNWYETVVLTNGTIAGEGVRCFSDSQLGGKTLADLYNCAPLCEPTSFFIKCLGAAGKTIQTSGSILAICSTDDDESLVELDTNVDASLSKELGEVLAIS